MSCHPAAVSPLTESLRQSRRLRVARLHNACRGGLSFSRNYRDRVLERVNREHFGSRDSRTALICCGSMPSFPATIPRLLIAHISSTCCSRRRPRFWNGRFHYCVPILPLGTASHGTVRDGRHPICQEYPFPFQLSTRHIRSPGALASRTTMTSPLFSISPAPSHQTQGRNCRNRIRRQYGLVARPRSLLTF